MGKKSKRPSDVEAMTSLLRERIFVSLPGRVEIAALRAKRKVVTPAGVRVQVCKKLWILLFRGMTANFKPLILHAGQGPQPYRRPPRAAVKTKRMSDWRYVYSFYRLNQNSVMPSLGRLITDPSDHGASGGRTPLKRSTWTRLLTRGAVTGLSRSVKKIFGVQPQSTPSLSGS